MLSLLAALILGEQPDFLPPDVLAVYEAGHGVLAINTTFDAFKDADADLIAVVNHETYHHLQTVCTGYGWRRSFHIQSIVLKHINAAGKREWKDNGGFYRAIRFLNWLPARVQKAIDVPRLEEALNFAIQSNQRVRLHKWADPADPSLAAAEYPGLFADLDVLRADMWMPRAEGLADGHVMEGAAVAHQILLTAHTRSGAEALAPAEGETLDKVMMALAEPLGADYATLFTIARAHAKRAVSLTVLPAAALALFYERPGAAFLPILDHIPLDVPEKVASSARALAARLPHIPAAGSILGTARQASALQSRGFHWPWRKPRSHPHDIALAGISSSSRDELSLLADVSRFGEIDGPVIGCVLRFNDEVKTTFINTPETLTRLMGASLALRARTRRFGERALEAQMGVWTQKLGSRLFGDVPL